MDTLLTQQIDPTALFRPMEGRLVEMDSAKTPAERRDAMMTLQAAMTDAPPEAHETPPVREHFAPGLYSREILMRAGLCVVGSIHRHAHLNVVSKGRCVVYTEDAVQHLDAGDTWVSKPGTKRCVFVIEDTLWTTVHANPTDSRDSAWLKSQLIADSFEALTFEAPIEVAA